MQLAELTPAEIKTSLKQKKMKIPYPGQNKADNGDTMIWANYKKWDIFLRKNGWKKLGAGSFSAVYGKAGLNYVLKVPFVRDRSWMEYADYCVKNRGNPHVMKVSFIKEETSNHFFIAAIERLQKFPNIDGQSTAEDVASYIQKLDRWATFQQVEVTLKYDITKFQRKGKKRRANWLEKVMLPQLPGLAKVVSQLGTGHDLDLHSGNIMMRGNTVVIIDPWFDRDEAKKMLNMYS